MDTLKAHVEEAEKAAARKTTTPPATTTTTTSTKELLKKEAVAAVASTPTTPESMIQDEPEDEDEDIEEQDDDEEEDIENDGIDMSTNANNNIITSGNGNSNSNNNNNNANAAAAAAAAAASVAAIAAALDLKPKIELLQAAAAHQQQQQQHHHHNSRLHRHHQQHHHGLPVQQQQQQQQKIKKLVRRNASDKLKLIQMVHDNPILWDSRLPNFKGAEEEKNRAWEQIGKEFNAPGRRVARAFKSLRESYRRELAHVKLMGSGFKPKWSLYDAMDFLRDVIRERKGGSSSNAHASANETAAAAATMIGLNLSAFSHHLNHSNSSSNNNNTSINNNNTNNHNNNNNNSHHNNKSYSLKQQLSSALHSSTFNENAAAAALNLTKCATSTLNLSNAGTGTGGGGIGGATSLHDDYYYFVKPEINLTAGTLSATEHQSNGHQTHHGSNGNGGRSSGGIEGVGIASAHHQHQQSQQHHQHLHHHTHLIPNAHQTHTNAAAVAAAAAAAAQYDSRVSSTRNDSSVQHITSYDDMDASSLRSGDEASSLRNAANGSHQDSDEIEELEAIDADFPYPLILGSNSPTAGDSNTGIIGSLKRKHKDDTNDNDYEGQMLQQHRHLRQQNGGNLGGFIGGGVGVGALGTAGLDMPPPQTVREVLNSKFCGFISAKLNSMKDIEADNLMNRILMLLVQTQSNGEGK